jgi:biotin carboxyl carrier protein
VKAGDLLFVVSAMKMETSVAAPCAGVVSTLAPLAVGDAVDGGQILAVIKPAAGAARPLQP